LTDPKDLTAAFHQAQDRALAEEVPLVFFDEFDSSLNKEPYGWLKYFLAPMEDGKSELPGRQGDLRIRWWDGRNIRKISRQSREERRG
jgi:hypothetical protein